MRFLFMGPVKTVCNLIFQPNVFIYSMYNDCLQKFTFDAAHRLDSLGKIIDATEYTDTLFI